MIKWGIETAKVKEVIEMMTIVTFIDNSGLQKKKEININGVSNRKSELIGNINMVIFSPEDLDLVKGALKETRVFR